MKKKLIMLGITIGFILISGICYSCTFMNGADSAVLVTPAPEYSENLAEENNLQESSPDDSNSSSEAMQPVTDYTADSAETMIYIHLCGAVQSPGVYQVDASDRLFDVIEMAGGLNEDAAGDYINQAQTLIDGQRIYIPTKEEVKGLSSGEYIEGDKNVQEDSSEASLLVNINEADEEELMNLPGIGQAKAGSIIEYRKTIGKFKSTEELMNIPGIKEGLFNQISSYITLN